MTDREKEYKEQLEDHEKKIKALEKRLDNQYEETERIRRRLKELEARVDRAA
jgi:ppGpp synthetase/RelA/SpoT-type nucleotidyltranferase